ncbi:MAG: hypothetical protein EBR82_63645 [Caulobacteraceae bacterium]|nr:hypothetical protein [Caulobacteraceae bacterium]
MSKTFSHAGVSKLNGEFKVRFCNDSLRVKVLAKNGHSDIDIIELPNSMTKEDVIAYLLSIDFATKDTVRNDAVHEAILAELNKRSDRPEGANRDRPKKEAKKPKQPPKPTMEGIKAKVEARRAEAPQSTLTRAEIEAQLKDMEEAPF